jgi:DNA-binding CsgD family transcriptional regulator
LITIEAEYATAPIKMCATFNLLGGIALIAGDVELAASRGESAVEMARALAADTDLGYALCGLGYARLQQDNPPEATACFLESLAIAWGNQDFAFLARLYWAFAALAMERQLPVVAAHLIGAADTLDARTGSAMWPNDRALADSVLGQLDRELGTEKIPHLRQRGSTLPVEQSVAAATQLAAYILGQQSAADTWTSGNGQDISAFLSINPGPDTNLPFRVALGGSLTNTSVDRLTPREHMVLLHLVDGCTDREIAARLFISRRTVSKHLEAIFTKLGVHSRGAAVAEAQRLGVSTTPFLNETGTAITAD